jgi:hypothetical protein
MGPARLKSVPKKDAAVYEKIVGLTDDVCERVRVAHRDYQRTDNRPQEWLLIEWPEAEKGPTKYWLSTLPEAITFRRLGRERFAGEEAERQRLLLTRDTLRGA